MMVDVINEGATLARVPGYTVAGKTGTAQIATPLGYENGIPGQTRASFVGFFPADDPQVVVYIMLDRPRTSEFGSQTAAPCSAVLHSDWRYCSASPPMRFVLVYRLRVVSSMTTRHRR